MMMSIVNGNINSDYSHYYYDYDDYNDDYDADYDDGDDGDDIIYDYADIGNSNINYRNKIWILKH